MGIDWEKWADGKTNISHAGERQMLQVGIRGLGIARVCPKAQCTMYSILYISPKKKLC